MKSVAVAILLLTLGSSSHAWAENCPEPEAPPAFTGASASQEQLTAAITSFRQFQASSDAFQKCLEDAIVAAKHDKSVPSSTIEDWVRRADASVTKQMSVADHLNAEIRAFNAKNGKPNPAS